MNNNIGWTNGIAKVIALVCWMLCAFNNSNYGQITDNLGQVIKPTTNPDIPHDGNRDFKYYKPLDPDVQFFVERYNSAASHRGLDIEVRLKLSDISASTNVDLVSLAMHADEEDSTILKLWIDGTSIVFARVIKVKGSEHLVALDSWNPDFFRSGSMLNKELSVRFRMDKFNRKIQVGLTGSGKWLTCEMSPYGLHHTRLDEYLKDGQHDQVYIGFPASSGTPVKKIIVRRPQAVLGSDCGSAGANEVTGVCKTDGWSNYFAQHPWMGVIAGGATLLTITTLAYAVHNNYIPKPSCSACKRSPYKKVKKDEQEEESEEESSSDQVEMTETSSGCSN